MRTAVRKLRTAARLMFARGGIRRAQQAARSNLRNWLIDLHRSHAFCYQSPLGFRFVCIPESETSRHLYVSRQAYEEAEAAACCRWLKAGDNCLDIGANVGLMATLFAGCVGRTGRVIAVEPVPATLNHLRTAVELLSLTEVQIEAACVSDAVGLVEFMVPDRDGLDILAALKVGADRAAEFHGVRLPATTLNRLVDQHQCEGNVALVKIDIEGAEPLALRGASRLLNSEHPPLFLVEVHKAALANMGFQPLDVLRHFPNEHFELHHVQRSTCDAGPRFEVGVLYPLDDPATHLWPWYSNVIAIPRIGQFSARRERIADLVDRRDEQ